MVMEILTGAQEGPPTTIPDIGAGVGAACEGTTWCVSCRCLATESGIRGLPTMVCTLAFLPPHLFFLSGAPEGTSLEALGANN